jgi:hypothetical protein
MIDAVIDAHFHTWPTGSAWRCVAQPSGSTASILGQAAPATRQNRHITGEYRRFLTGVHSA